MSKTLQDLLVLSDLDGTLVTSKMTVVPRNRRAVEHFVAQGGRFTLSTGRSLHGALYTTQGLTFSAPAILLNGALIYDFSTQRPLFEKFLEAEYEDCLQELTLIFPDFGIELMGKDSLFLLRDHPMVQKHIQDEQLSTPTRISFGDMPRQVYKVLLAAQPAVIDQIETFVQTLLYDQLSYVRSSPHYFEILPKGVSKGSALKILCNLCQVPLTNTVAIGDYYNDLTLLQTAGFPVCVSTAPWEIQSICRMVVSSCEEGGVAELLEFLEQNNR